MIINIDINKLHPHIDNPRKDLGDMSELSESMKTRGVLQNLTVVPRDKGDYTVVIGHRRLAAAKLAGLTMLPCVVADMTEKEQIETMLLENLQRSDLTPLEQAAGFQMMMDLGESVSSIAKSTGFGETTIRHRLKLNELDKVKLQKSIERGVTMADYIKLEQIKDVKLRNSVLDVIGTNNFEWQFRDALTKEKIKENKPGMIKQVEAFAKKIKESEAYGGKYQWLDLLRFSENEKIKKPKDADEVEYFYCANDTSVTLYKLRPKSEKVEKSPDEIERENRKKLCADIAKQAYELRVEFIRDFNVTKNNQAAVISMAATALFDGVYMDEKVFRNLFNIEKAFKNSWDINKEGETFDEAKVRLLGLKSTYDVNTLLTAAYFKLEPGSKGDCMCSWTGTFEKNKRLDRLYSCLSSLGYQISSVEESMLDAHMRCM